MNNPIDVLGSRTAGAVDHPTGPDVGECLPDITLPDQSGKAVNVEQARGDGRALVVFHRSLRWWPFCRSQLVQLQRNLEQFERAGISVFASSYDPVEAQATFAEQNGVTYSLLSGADHKVIEATGILNRLVDDGEDSREGGAVQEQSLLKVAPNPSALLHVIEGD